MSKPTLNTYEAQRLRRLRTKQDKKSLVGHNSDSDTEETDGNEDSRKRRPVSGSRRWSQVLRRGAVRTTAPLRAAVAMGCYLTVFFIGWVFTRLGCDGTPSAEQQVCRKNENGPQTQQSLARRASVVAGRGVARCTWCCASFFGCLALGYVVAIMLSIGYFYWRLEPAHARHLRQGAHLSDLAGRDAALMASESPYPWWADAQPPTAVAFQPAFNMTMTSQTVVTAGVASCNKHNRPQAFLWGVIERALRHERLGRNTRIVRENTGNTVVEETLKAPHESQHQSLTETGTDAKVGPPADAFLWLGDVIYADSFGFETSQTAAASAVEAYVSMAPHNEMLLRKLRAVRASMTEAQRAAQDKRLGQMGVSLDASSTPATPYEQFQAQMRIETNTVKGRSGEQRPADSMSSAVSFYPIIAERDILSGSRGGAPANAPMRTPRSRILGVWDDHDLGLNDGGKEYPLKNATANLLLDFLEVADSSPPSVQQEPVETLRERAVSSGVYSFHAVPFPPSAEGAEATRAAADYQHALCIVLLDARHNRDPIRYDGLGDILGEAQWAWLERIFSDHVSDTAQTATSLGKLPCAATIIGNGIQTISGEKPTEHWNNFPASRRRLESLLRKHNVNRAVFLSGDIHLLELMKQYPEEDEGEANHDGGDRAEGSFSGGLGYPMVDFTTSGLTHSTGELLHRLTALVRPLLRSTMLSCFSMMPQVPYCSPYHVPAPLPAAPATVVAEGQTQYAAGCYPLADYLTDWLYDVTFPSPYRVGRYLGRNFGAVSLVELRHWRDVNASLLGDDHAVIAAAGADAASPSYRLALRFSAYAVDEPSEVASFMFDRRGVNSAHPLMAAPEDIDRFRVLDFVQPLDELHHTTNTTRHTRSTTSRTAARITLVIIFYIKAVQGILFFVTFGASYARVAGIVLAVLPLLFAVGSLSVFLVTQMLLPSGLRVGRTTYRALACVGCWCCCSPPARGKNEKFDRHGKKSRRHGK